MRDTFGSKLKRIPRDPGSDRFFIEGHRPTGQNSWEWVTGKPLVIQPWMGKFPNSKEIKEGGVTIFDLHFDDVGSRIFTSGPFLVEWDEDGSSNSAPAVPQPVQAVAATPVPMPAVETEKKPPAAPLRPPSTPTVAAAPI